MTQNAKFEDLKGLTLAFVQGEKYGEEMIFLTDKGRKFILYHERDCCERVRIDDIMGDISDLIGSPLLLAEEVTDEYDDSLYEYNESLTWTFYKLSTIKGSVIVRWLGESNGYYSESVNFIEVLEEEQNDTN